MTELTPLLAQRFSARSFDGSPISPAALRSILEAARWAPSSINEQPWAFIVAPRQDEAAFAQLLGCLNEKNQFWAKDAAVLMACCASMQYSKWQGQPNHHAWHDVGLAVMAMAVQGVSLGLQMREMGGIDRDKTRQTYGVPEGHEITTGLALGMPGDVKDQLAKRERKPLESFVFEGAWGKKAGFLG